MNGAMAVQSQEQPEPTLIRWSDFSPPVVEHEGIFYQVFGGKGRLFSKMIEVVKNDSGRYESNKNANMIQTSDAIKQMLSRRLIQNQNKKK